MFPKRLQITEKDREGAVIYGTLGGTFIRDTDLLTNEQLDQLDKTEFKKLADRNSLFFWGRPFEQASQ
jgi:hypothetical protein